MKSSASGAVTALAVIAVGLALSLAGCGEKQPPAATDTQATAPPADAAAPPTGTTTTEGAQSPWSPESLEELLAPVALYPDPVLAQVLATSTNPQEVLDAGNWLVQNPDLKGKELETAATSLGFTPPMVALVQFPTVVDMMCMEMNWTTELGAAFQADEPGVLDAVQRLRGQAAAMGNLQSSEQMKVVTEKQNDQQIIVVQPANPQVVYVPQYEPAAAYTTAAPAVVPTTAPTGHSTGTLITTGLLAFGAGILVNEMFDDDDHHDNDDYYYPRWGHGYGGRGYYPPPYRPVYGGGFRPGHNYSRPANYQHGFNNNNVVINTGGNDYFNRFDGDSKGYRDHPKSPISAARPNRTELQELNSRSRPASTPTVRQRADDRKPQGTYAGAKPGAKPGARDGAAVTRSAAGVAAKDGPKVPQGTYQGAKSRAEAKPLPRTAGTRDRGRDASAPAARPSGGAAQQAARPQNRPAASTPAQAGRASAFEGARDSGKAERAASQRGRASKAQAAKPQGAKPKAKAKSEQKRGR